MACMRLYQQKLFWVAQSMCLKRREHDCDGTRGVEDAQPEDTAVFRPRRVQSRLVSLIKALLHAIWQA